MGASASKRRLYAVGALAASPVFSFLVHCGSENGSLSDPCKADLEGLCGARCATSDEECAPVLHCSAGTCKADCSAKVPCPDGLLCTPRGRCNSDGRDPDEGTFGPGDGGDGGDVRDASVEACASIDVTLAKVIPTVVLLIDQSSSMNQAFGSAGTRWNVLRDALLAADGGIIKPLENEVRWGLALYTFSGQNNSPQCPTLTQVSYKIGNYSSIYDTYADAAPQADTPTGDSIDKVIGRLPDGGFVDGGLATIDAGGPKFIVLATDGEPDRCEELNPQNGQAEAIAAAQAAYSAGVKTYIIAVGNDVSQTHQQQMANAGSGQSVDAGDAGYFTTTDKQQLVAALRTVILGVRSCKFALDGQVVAGTESQGEVKLDGKLLLNNDPNGWRLDTSTEIELLGTSCDAVKQGTPTLSVRFPCGAFVAPQPK